MSVRTPNTASPGQPGDPSRSEPPYPWRLFIGMLLAIIVGGAILAVALGLNPLTLQRSGPAVQATPATAAPPVATLPAPAATATPAIISTPVSGAASTAVPTAQAGGAPAAVQTPVAIATSQAIAVPAATGARTGGTPAATEAAIPIAEAQPTPVQAAVSPELAEAIINGYDNYWSVRVRASSNPNDTSLDLGSVMAEGELEAAYKTLAQYREEGVAFRTTVDHQIWITHATPTEAVIVDQYSGRSLKLNPANNEPDGSDPVAESFADAFFLKNIDGTWKVVGEQPWVQGQ